MNEQIENLLAEKGMQPDEVAHQKLRPDNALPQCTEEWGWKYHHLGIPTAYRLT